MTFDVVVFDGQMLSTLGSQRQTPWTAGHRTLPLLPPTSDARAAGRRHPCQRSGPGRGCTWPRFVSPSFTWNHGAAQHGTVWQGPLLI